MNIALCIYLEDNYCEKITPHWLFSIHTYNIIQKFPREIISKSILRISKFREH